jgi:hypothetical protein
LYQILFKRLFVKKFLFEKNKYNIVDQKKLNMKKSIFSLILMLFAVISAIAQTDASATKPFKVYVSPGYAIPGGTGAKGGVLFAIEPKYDVVPNISVGLRLETDITVSGTSLSSNSLNNTTYKAQASASYLATGDYYFTTEDFKPFGGVGLGVFTTAGLKVNDGNGSNNTANASTKFGELVRAGFDYRHLRVAIEYNIVPKTTVAASTSTSGDGYDITNSYLGIKIGVLIGGGKK